MRGFGSYLVAASLACSAGASYADLTTGLIAHYTLDGHAADSSPNANHGTPGATLVATTDRFGAAGGAYEFNGTNSYITVPNSPSLSSPSTAITMSAWVLLYGNSKVGSPFGPVLMKSTESTNAFMYRLIASPTYFGAAYNDWNLHQSAAATIPLDTWHHVATTFDGALHRFYFDGEPVESQALALTIAPDTRPLTIGADFPGLFECFWGKIDELRIYNRRLTAPEIAELYGGTVDAGDPMTSTALAIRRAFPIPTRGAVSLEFTLPVSAPVEVAVHDVSGRRIRSISLGEVPSGSHAIVWDGRSDSGESVGAGIFFVWLRAAGERSAARVVRTE